ncbi:MAG: DUF2085 domain-containing protein [Vicinamibacterales bacterium]
MRLLFAVLACGWAIALPLAPLGNRPDALLPGSLLSQVVYAAGAAVCHQQPARSFALAGVPLPVCARCTGIYAGAAAAVLMAGLRRRRAAAARSPRDTQMVFAAAAAPIILTVAIEMVTGAVPSGLIRAASGVPMGAAVAWTVLAFPRNAGQSG